MTIRIEKETQKLKTKIRLSGRLQRKTVSSSSLLALHRSGCVVKNMEKNEARQF